MISTVHKIVFITEKNSDLGTPHIYNCVSQKIFEDDNYSIVLKKIRTEPMNVVFFITYCTRNNEEMFVRGFIRHNKTNEVQDIIDYKTLSNTRVGSWCYDIVGVCKVPQSFLET